MVFRRELEKQIADRERENAELKEKLEKETNHRIQNFNKSIEWKEKHRELKKENRLLGKRCNQLLKDKGSLTDQIADIKANCDLAIEGRGVKIMELEQQIEKMKNCEICKHHRWNHCSYEIRISADCIQNKMKHFELKEIEK